MSTTERRQFEVYETTVAAGSSEIWYPKYRYLDCTIRMIVTAGATASVQFSTDPQSVLESGSGITWTAASTNLTSQTTSNYDTLLGPITALKLISTADTTKFQIVSRF